MVKYLKLCNIKIQSLYLSQQSYWRLSTENPYQHTTLLPQENPHQKTPFYQPNLIYLLQKELQKGTKIGISITFTKYNAITGKHTVDYNSGHAMTLWHLDDTYCYLTDSDSDPDVMKVEYQKHAFVFNESPDKFGWPNYGRILNEKKKNIHTRKPARNKK